MQEPVDNLKMTESTTPYGIRREYRDPDGQVSWVEYVGDAAPEKTAKPEPWWMTAAKFVARYAVVGLIYAIMGRMIGVI